MNVINFDYEGNEIPFRVDENNQVFMNATEMAKPFKGKKVGNFMRNKEVLDHVNAINELNAKAQIRALADSELVTIKKGGNDSGTWFQEDLALEFSRWLNPKFGVWCNQRIKEILNQGFSALTADGRDDIDRRAGFVQRNQRVVWQMLKHRIY